MCFRPAEISMKVCPSCGKQNKPIAKVCEHCGAALEDMKVDFDADQASLDAAKKAPAGAPTPPAPGAPQPPSAPPQTPGAPQ